MQRFVLLVQCLLLTAFLVVNATEQRPLFVGGRREIDTNDPELKTLAKESLHKYLKDSNTTVHHDVIEIKKATKQVVAGSLKRINFIASPTNCELVNGELKEGSKNCEVKDPSVSITCNSKILEKSWENFKQIEVSCN